jgi:integrase
LSALKGVLRWLGLPGKLHTFRHAFISNALLQGRPVAVVQEWVGHVDEQIIGHYTHVHSDASQSTMRKLATANKGRRSAKRVGGNNRNAVSSTNLAQSNELSK